MKNNLGNSELASSWYQKALKVLPGGVNAAARYNSVLKRPFYITHAKGAKVFDQDNREYFDLHMSSGAAILGHNHPKITEAISKIVSQGISCGYEISHSIELASKLVKYIPCAELVRFCGTGTEATWHASRIAKAYTKRKVLVKFEGHFHGFNDSLGYNFHTNPSQWSEKIPYELIPESEGTINEMNSPVIVLPFNDFEAAEKTFSNYSHQIAGVILEPINFNSGSIMPQPGFLQLLRALTSQHGALLIFDEILSGFRTGISCAQGYFDVLPDLAILGKALGAGIPISAVVGLKEIMKIIAPSGKVMHSGTYISSPISVGCSLTLLEILSSDSFYPDFLIRGEKFRHGLVAIFDKYQIPIKVQGLGDRFSLLFGIKQCEQILNYRNVAIQDGKMAHLFYSLCLENGVYMHPGFHHGISNAYQDDEIAQVLNLFDKVSKKLASIFPNFQGLEPTSTYTKSNITENAESEYNWHISYSPESSKVELHVFGYKNRPNKIKFSPFSEDHRCLIVSDHNVSEFALWVIEQLDANGVQYSHVPYTGSKSLHGAEKIWTDMCEYSPDFVVAVGGGTICDLTGFTASCYRRGIPVMFFPTTLLAMVDVIISGKTAIDFNLLKNPIGSIHFPFSTYLITEVLETLSKRHFKSAFAEMIKMAMTCNGLFFEDLVAFGRHSKSSLQELMPLIHKSCKLKSILIERGGEYRKLSLYGHVIGHAVEAIGQGQWLHGECVAIGLNLEGYIAVKLGLMNYNMWAKQKQLILDYELPLSIPKNISLNDVLAAMKKDKLVKNNLQGFVFPVEMGNMLEYKGNIVNYVSFDEIKNILENYIDKEQN